MHCTIAGICTVQLVTCLSLSVTGCTLVLTASSIKGECRLSWTSIVVVMAFEWRSSLESTRPPDISSRCILGDARRVFASSKNTCYLRGRQPCFSRLIHPSRLVPGGLMVEAVSEAFAVCWNHSPGGSFGGSPLDGFYRDGIVFVAKHIREKSRCKKRICDVSDHASLLANKPFLPERF